MPSFRFPFFITIGLFTLIWARPLPTQAINQVPYGLTPADWAQIEPFLPSGYFKASNTGTNDWFGYAVAVDGDTIVVGARWEQSNATGVNGNQADNSAPSSGAAYVFTRTAGVWSQQAYLKASNTDIGDSFGYSVAVDGDTIVVGAHREASNATGVNGNQTDNSAVDAGAVYVFTRTAGVWSQQAYLKASNTEAEDGFGAFLAIDSNTLVVVADEEDSNATGVNGNQTNNSAEEAGAAYVFTRAAGVWSQQAYLKASNTEGFDRFGRSIALDGNTIVVGALFEDSNGNQTDNSIGNSGAAYVFTRTAGVWSQQAYLKASNPDVNDQFGVATAISGDTLAVGAWREASNATGVNGNQMDNSAANAGAVYIFTRTAGVWSQQAYLKASNTETGDWFGYNIGLEGDTLAIAAVAEDSNATGVNGNQADNSATNSGAAYLFTRTAGVWSQQAYLKASNTEANDAFGLVVALSGERLVVGAYEEDSQATGVNGDQMNNTFTNSGAVYLFDSGVELTVQTVGDGQVTTVPAGIACGTICTLGFELNMEVTLTAAADPGYTFAGWSGDVTSTENSITVTMDEAKNLTATFIFNPNQYNIALTADPAEGGTVTGGGLVTHGQVVTVTATAETGYTFVNWTENGDVVSTEANYSFTATAGRNLVAHFVATPSLPKIYLPLIRR